MKKKIALSLLLILLAAASFLGGFRTGIFATELSPEETQQLIDALRVNQQIHSFAATCKHEGSGLTAGAMVVDD